MAVPGARGNTLTQAFWNPPTLAGTTQEAFDDLLDRLTQ